MYKNSYALFQKVEDIQRAWGKIFGPSNNRVKSSKISNLTEDCIITTELPCAGCAPSDVVIKSNGPHYAITLKGFQGGYFDLDEEYESFVGYRVENGMLYLAFKYTLPKKYYTAVWRPLDKAEWEQALPPLEKINND
jgi:hypothetical protein